ncbi:ROK family protein [Georgenia sp. Z1344]|uniref:ROK family protein n=1 Tax=Georgenia sp. Z1344 TaxID=3416706 RepID=UPI003CE67566
MDTDVSPQGWLRDSPGAVYQLFRHHLTPLTKSDVARHSGLSRSAINARIAPLIDSGLLGPADTQGATGGRPAERFELNAGWGLLLIADMGATAIRAAVCDLRATFLAEKTAPVDITSGPEAILAVIGGMFDELLASTGRLPADVVGVGLDVPGPVDHELGRVVRPPIMPGWHDYDIPAFFKDRFSCPVLVEKDTNAMALGEQSLNHSAISDLVFVKLGTGIGTGMVLRGSIYRGADGAAGDIGHIPIESRSDEGSPPICRCGNYGCLEAYVSGWAFVRELESSGFDVKSVDDAVQLIRAREPAAVELVRRSADVIGTSISHLVNIVNPRRIVIGGQIAGVDDSLIAGIRETVYRRSLPLATRDLEIVPSTLGSRAGVYGLARLVLDDVLVPERIDHILSMVA